MSAQPQNDPKDMPKNNRDSVGEDSAISSLVSRIWNAKEEKGGITQMIKNFTSSTPPPTAPITTLSIQSEQGTTTSTITTTGTTTTTTKKDETTSIVFEKIRGLTSYIDNAPSALTSLLSSTPNSASPPVTSATVEEVTVKKLEVNQPPNVKRRSGTNAEPPKRGLLDYIQDKFTKKDEPKVGGLNITIKLVPGQEYNINMAQISQQQDKPSLNYTFDALMDKVRTIVVSNPSFPGNSSVDPSSPCFSISPPAPSYMPTSTSSGIDQQYLCTFLSILTKLEIVSAPPYTTKVTQLSKYASTMVNLQSLRVEGLPDITSLATETTSLKVLEDFRLVKLGLKSFPAELMQMTKLRTIDVSSNNINSLPSKGFGGLSKLEVLLLGSNQISSLPSDFTNLQNLNHLDLQKNKFDINTVTPILVDLCSPGQNYTSTSVTSPQPIRDANASSGRASPVVPRRTEPVELRTLNFSGNKAAALPLSFAKLTSLTNLDMSSSEMSLWPNEVLHSLTRLVTLNLGHNHIAHLPHDLPRLASISKLILASNTLKKIPIEFCPTYPSLTELDLSANKLSSLPENFSTLRSLKLLRLQKNDFEGEIPQQILALSTLTELDLSDNSLDKWWSDDKALRKLDSLVTLNLSANDLTEIGPGIGSLSALLSLDLSQNNLAALPPQIGKLTSLRNLQLHTNPMDKFPSEFSRLTKLTKLSAGNVTISEKEVGSVNEEQVNLFRLTSIAKSAPHPLIVIALGILCERDELHQQMMDTGTIHVLVHFTDSSHFDIKLDATKSLCVLSINENLREDLFGAASARLMELCEDKNTQIQVYALTTLGNIAFKETVRLGMLTKYGHQLFAKLAKDKLQDMGVRKKSRRVLAILGINEFFLPWNPKKKGVRILTIDGGGTRGVATLELLKKLEEITGKRLHQLFDLVGGTSTGAQLCAAMSVRQLPLVEYQRMYIEQCANIFTTTTTTAAPAATAAAAAAADATSATSTWSTALSSQWAKISLYSNVLTTGAFYKSKNLEDALIAFFEDRILIDTIEDYDLRFFATSTLVNTLPSQPYIFRNYQYPVNSHSRYLGSCTARVWQALRASTAAPSYFDEFTMGNDRFQDGGIVANNPTAIAYHEARKIWGPDVKIDCVVSLGTGKPPPKQTKNSIKDTIITLVDSATSTDRIHEIMEDVIPEGRYFRFNPLDEAFSVDLDETRQEKLEAMQVAARKYIVENEDLFKKACKLLMGDES